MIRDLLLLDPISASAPLGVIDHVLIMPLHSLTTLSDVEPADLATDVRFMKAESFSVKSLPWPYPGYRTSGRKQEILNDRSKDQVLANSGCTGAAEAKGCCIYRFVNVVCFLCQGLLGFRSGAAYVSIIAKTCPIVRAAVKALSKATPDPGITIQAICIT